METDALPLWVNNAHRREDSSASQPNARPPGLKMPGLQGRDRAPRHRRIFQTITAI